MSQQMHNTTFLRWRNNFIRRNVVRLSGLHPPSTTGLMTDIIMPGSMDGIKLAAVVRERYPSIGIVLVSGEA
jgi:CheY-like chemotaxis protein